MASSRIEGENGHCVDRYSVPLVEVVDRDECVATKAQASAGLASEATHKERVEGGHRTEHAEHHLGHERVRRHRACPSVLGFGLSAAARPTRPPASSLGSCWPTRGGGVAYHLALEEATGAEGLGSDDLGFRVSSHLLRKSLATDLAWQAGIEDPIRRRFMGHRAGDDVYGRIYTLDHPEVAPLTKVAAFLDDQVTATTGTLLTPTIRRVHWGANNPLATRTDHIDAVLAAAGWQVDPGSPDDPLCDTERVAAELGLARSATRRCMADGTLPAVIAPDGAGVPRRYVRLSDAWAYRDHRAGRGSCSPTSPSSSASATRSCTTWSAASASTSARTRAAASTS